MATAFNFNGRLIDLPGSYAQIQSGVTNPPRNLSYGNVLIMDNRAAEDFGGGAGINGTLQSGADAIYTFDNIRDFRKFVGGGRLWDLAAPLFKPYGAGSIGISQLIYVRALNTVAASIDVVWSGGTFTVKTRHEGLVGNGVMADSPFTGEFTDEFQVGQILAKGFGMAMELGTSDPTKYRLKFYRGSYVGAGADLLPYNGLPIGSDQPTIIATSPEFGTVQELFAWMGTDFDFNNNFSLTASTVIGDGTVTADDLIDTAGMQIFTGGSQTASSAATDAVIDVIGALDYTHILSLDAGSSALSADNFKLLYHIQNEARYEKFMVIAGGKNKNEYASVSKATAAAFNSHRVIVVHGAPYDFVGNVPMKEKTTLHKAAYVLGRTAGLAPQTPCTFKALGYQGEVHKMTDPERSQALKDGVLTTYYDSEIRAFVITQGINTLQGNANVNVVNENGTSHQWSLMRIAAQLNKEIEVNSKIQLLGNQNQGPNRSTLSPQVVQDWVKSFLKRKEARPTEDNLILSFRDVTVTIQQDAYFIRYAFEPNFEVNKLFFTGLIIDPNLS